MAAPARFANLPDYAFPRLRRLLDAHAPGGPVVHMSIGEPKHPMPAFVAPVLAANTDGFAVYPPNDGAPELLSAITGWLARRYEVRLAEDQVMVLNGTREGLYNAAIALCPEEKAGATPAILMPNPFYQVYAVAALTVGAEPVYVPATAATGFLPDYAGLAPALLDRVAAVYICSPANPQGVVAGEGYWRDLIALAHRHDFVILADECYSEIWRDAPPAGALQVAKAMGADPERVFVFHSLSKRSNLPGLRSGFVAGGPVGIAAMRKLRAFAGAPVPLPLQRVAEAAWADEAHVEANRALYQAKFRAADDVFAGMQGYAGPAGGFFLWLPVPGGDGEAAALQLWQRTGVRVLPGAYLSRDTGQNGAGGGNPGAGYIRVAMVAPINEMTQGLCALRDCLYG